MSYQILPEAVVFLNPPYKYIIQRKLRCSPRRCAYVFPPSELLSLASAIANLHDVKLIFIDAIAERLSLKKVVNKLKGYRIRELVFMPGFESFEEDLRTISKIRENLNEDCRIISFGYLPTLYYKDIFQKFPLVNYIIIGEPEATFMELSAAILAGTKDLSHIGGLAINESSGITVSGKRENSIELDSLPLPNRRLLRNDRYADPFLKKPMTSVVTSRGCPYNCAFCVNFYGRAFRQRSAKNVIRELKQIVTDYNIRSIRFMDDNFTIDKNRIIEICKGIIDNKLRLNWTCLSRIDTLDKETLAWMSESGCRAVFLGIESGSQKVLDYYKKGYTVDLIKRQCRLIKESGIDIVSWFIIGAPVETAEDVKLSLKLSLEINSDFVCINELQLMPTTALFRISRGAFHLSPAEISRLRRKFYLGFYLNPKIIRKTLLRLAKKPEGSVFFMKEFFSAIREKYIEK
ncbi:MAG: radical SAM protein [Candidatus Omnitrophica bacterium]|nr:radical SAM protein [Candidatus Omnitrophota bacterium]